MYGTEAKSYFARVSLPKASSLGNLKLYVTWPSGRVKL